VQEVLAENAGRDGSGSAAPLDMVAFYSCKKLIHRNWPRCLVSGRRSASTLLHMFRDSRIASVG